MPNAQISNKKLKAIVFTDIVDFTKRNGYTKKNGTDFTRNDVIQMVNIVLGNIVANEWQECASDSNGDGNIDVLDVIQAVPKYYKKSLGKL